jgi:hypothetical protein
LISGEGETSVAMGAMGAVEGAGAVTDVGAVGEEVGEGSFLANAFFSLARLFWNHTFSRKAEETNGVRFFSEAERKNRRG